jgi:hypothetical protein
LPKHLPQGSAAPINLEFNRRHSSLFRSKNYPGLTST